MMTTPAMITWNCIYVNRPNITCTEIVVLLYTLYNLHYVFYVSSFFFFSSLSLVFLLMDFYPCFYCIPSISNGEAKEEEGKKWNFRKCDTIYNSIQFITRIFFSPRLSCIFFINGQLFMYYCGAAKRKKILRETSP